MPLDEHLVHNFFEHIFLRVEEIFIFVFLFCPQFQCTITIALIYRCVYLIGGLLSMSNAQYTPYWIKTMKWTATIQDFDTLSRFLLYRFILPRKMPANAVYHGNGFQFAIHSEWCYIAVALMLSFLPSKASGPSIRSHHRRFYLFQKKRNLKCFWKGLKDQRKAFK